jgi:mRNA interferase HicA
MSVKRNAFIKHLENNNCFFCRHGSKHDIIQNQTTKKKTTVPRHPQLDKKLCELICKQLEIPKL